MWQVKYGLGGGFGGCGEWEDTDCKTRKEAEDLAYELARGEYFNYSGLHGLFNEEEALEEDPDLTEEDLNDMMEEDIERWIEYKVREV